MMDCSEERSASWTSYFSSPFLWPWSLPLLPSSSQRGNGSCPLPKPLHGLARPWRRWAWPARAGSSTLPSTGTSSRLEHRRAAPRARRARRGHALRNARRPRDRRGVRAVDLRHRPRASAAERCAGTGDQEASPNSSRCPEVSTPQDDGVPVDGHAATAGAVVLPRVTSTLPIGGRDLRVNSERGGQRPKPLPELPDGQLCQRQQRYDDQRLHESVHPPPSNAAERRSCYEAQMTTRLEPGEPELNGR